ncbi:MAG TPA: hypothetical protein VG778_05480 [Blastocatellia bacterium]|jgi:hypothetical protein|nr:hypothetical protein [Blastocatellia bacterium]
MPAKKNPLKDLETRLNKDDALQRVFLKDPVGLLKREGVELSPSQAREIKAQFTNLQLPKIQTAALRPRISISISITIRF